MTSTRWQRRRPATGRRTGALVGPRCAGPRRVHALRRGEQGVRLERLEHAHGLRRPEPVDVRHAGELRPAVGRLPGPAAHRRHDRRGGRGGDLADRGLRRLDGRQRDHEPARHDHLHRRTRLGRGAPPADQRRHGNAEWAGAGQRGPLRLDDLRPQQTPAAPVSPDNPAARRSSACRCPRCRTRSRGWSSHRTRRPRARRCSSSSTPTRTGRRSRGTTFATRRGRRSPTPSSTAQPRPCW